MKNIKICKKWYGKQNEAKNNNNKGGPKSYEVESTIFC